MPFIVSHFFFTHSMMFLIATRNICELLELESLKLLPHQRNQSGKMTSELGYESKKVLSSSQTEHAQSYF
jgi:hypothetical protein